jgi:large subunit ribosomal protein L10
MSKYVKQLLTDHLRDRLGDSSDLLVVSVTGMDANSNSRLRKELRSKNIDLMVVKNSMARRATSGTSLELAFQGLDGPAAVVWGGEDIVTLAKVVTQFTKDKQYEPFTARGGLMEGSVLTAEDVEAVSKWPSREEQLSLLVGQILGPGAKLAAQLNGPGGKLVSQVKKKAEGDEATEGE